MEEEELTWRKAQSSTDSGKNLGDGDIAMDIDEDEDGAVCDDDITDGCYVLNIGIDNFNPCRVHKGV
jgi:hypothetical protein